MSDFRYEPDFPINKLNYQDKRFMSRTDMTKMESNINLLMQDISLRGQIDPVGIGRVIDEDDYIIIYGFTRTAAIKALGWSKIKANLYDGISDKDARILNASNNSMREDLNPWERALQIKKLRAAGVPVDSNEEKDTITKLMKVDRRTIFNWLKVVEYDCQELHDSIAQEKISLRHALEMVNYPIDTVKNLIQPCIDEEWTSGILKLKLESATLHGGNIIAGKDSIQSATLHHEDNLPSKDENESATLHDSNEGIEALRRAATFMMRIQPEDLTKLDEKSLTELGSGLKTVMSVIAGIGR